MKKLKFFSLFYRQSPIAVLILCLIMTASVFNMVEFIGTYTYYTDSLKMFDEITTEDGIYFMPSTLEEQFGDKIYDALLAQQFPAIEGVICPSHSYVGYQEIAANIKIYDNEYMKAVQHDELQWFAIDDTAKTGPIDIVLSGYYFNDVSVGDVIDLSVYHLDNTFWKTEQGRVIGKDNNFHQLALGHSGPTMSTDLLFDTAHNEIYMTAESYKRLYEIADIREYALRPKNMLLCFTPESTEAERQQVLDYIAEKGHYQTFEEIRETSRQAINQQLRQELPMPLFMLVVSTVAMLSISILLTDKQMQDYRIYYLAGCSRRKSFVNILAGIGLIGLVAGVLNSIYIALFPYIYTNIFSSLSLSVEDNYKYTFFILNTNVILYVAVYILGAILLSTAIPFLLMRKQTAIDVYRR